MDGAELGDMPIEPMNGELSLGLICCEPSLVTVDSLRARFFGIERAGCESDPLLGLASSLPAPLPCCEAFCFEDDDDSLVFSPAASPSASDCCSWDSAAGSGAAPEFIVLRTIDRVFSTVLNFSARD